MAAYMIVYRMTHNGERIWDVDHVPDGPGDVANIFSKKREAIAIAEDVVNDSAEEGSDIEYSIVTLTDIKDWSRGKVKRPQPKRRK